MVAIVRRMTETMFDMLMMGVDDDYSPLKRVMPHVAKAQLERAYTLLEMAVEEKDRYSFTSAEVRLEAEKEIVRLYVTEDFCGLCGRYTDHVGEH